MDGDKKKRKDIFDIIFNDFDKLLEKMIHSYESKEENSPFVFGFTVIQGPDNNLEIAEFDDIEISEGEYIEIESDMSEIFEIEDEISIMMELPVSSEEDFRIELKDQSNLEVCTEADSEYINVVQIELPSPVEMESMSYTFKNGVLDIKLKKKVDGQVKA